MEQFDYIGTTMGLGDSSPPNGVHGRSKGKPHPLQKPETNACVGLLYKKIPKNIYNTKQIREYFCVICVSQYEISVYYWQSAGRGKIYP